MKKEQVSYGKYSTVKNSLYFTSKEPDTCIFERSLEEYFVLASSRPFKTFLSCGCEATQH